MKNKKIVLAFFVCAVALVFAVSAVLALSSVEKKTEKAVAQQHRLARADMADAAERMADSAYLASVYDFARAAGEMQAYLSRAGLVGCERAYALIDKLFEALRQGEDVKVLCARLEQAAKAALNDDGEALRALLASDEVAAVLFCERGAKEEFLSLERIGDGGEKRAERTARRFACRNAGLEICEYHAFPPMYVMSGKNVYAALTSDCTRVLEYCFDREVDLRRDIGEAKARSRALLVLDSQRIGGLFETGDVSVCDGVYRFSFTDKALSGELAVIEIYADNGRLRRYSAVEYYRNR
jgi:hypothetical protein